MTPKTGRPPIGRTIKDKSYLLRLSDSDNRMLDYCVEVLGLARSEIMRKGIRRMYLVAQRKEEKGMTTSDLFQDVFDVFEDSKRIEDITDAEIDAAVRLLSNIEDDEENDPKDREKANYVRKYFENGNTQHAIRSLSDIVND